MIRLGSTRALPVIRPHGPTSENLLASAVLRLIPHPRQTTGRLANLNLSYPIRNANQAGLRGTLAYDNAV